MPPMTGCQRFVVMTADYSPGAWSLVLSSLTACDLRLGTCDFRRSHSPSVHGFVLVGHRERRGAGESKVGDRFEGDGQAHADDALVATHDVDAARPKRRGL